MTGLEKAFWWIGILVNVAAIGLYLWASCVGDWKIGLRALAPLVFIIVLVLSRKTIENSRAEVNFRRQQIIKAKKKNMKGTP